MSPYLLARILGVKQALQSIGCKADGANVWHCFWLDELEHDCYVLLR